MIYNFSWIVPEKVGGMGRPAGREDLEWLVGLDVTAIVSLTELALEPVEGLEVLHVPIVDMAAPTQDQLDEIVSFIRGAVAQSGKVVAHCAAGMGRTGTALAAYMVTEGLNATEAMAFLRTVRPGSIETRAQEEAIAAFAKRRGEQEGPSG